MKRFIQVFFLILLSLGALAGCQSKEPFTAFSLSRVDAQADPEIPQLYVATPMGNKKELQIHYTNDVSQNKEAYYKVYELEAVIFDQSKIILAFEGEEIHFNRLSPTIAEREEDKVWYQYSEYEEEESL